MLFRKMKLVFEGVVKSFVRGSFWVVVLRWGLRKKVVFVKIYWYW